MSPAKDLDFILSEKGSYRGFGFVFSRVVTQFDLLL